MKKLFLLDGKPFVAHGTREIHVKGVPVQALNGFSLERDEAHGRVALRGVQSVHPEKALEATAEQALPVLLEAVFGPGVTLT